MNVVETYRTVHSSSFFHTFVATFQWIAHAYSAYFTMKSVFTATYPTNAAFFAMIYLFWFPFVIVEYSHITVVLCKLLWTFDASWWFWLNFFTSEALNLSYFVSIELMMYFRIDNGFKLFIMTQSTWIELAIANRIWTLLPTSSYIMFARKN